MSNRAVFKAAGLIMAVMVVSRIIGFVRDVIIYSQFGQNRITDAYNAAFSIPDFLYMLLVGGALSSSFIPVFSKYISTGNEKEGWHVANIVLNSVLILMIVGIIIGFMFTKELIMVLVPGFKAESLEMTVNLTRIMFFQSFLMALNGVTFAILNAYKIFFVPSLGTILYNLAIIIIGLIFAPWFEAAWGPGYGIAAFAVGVVVGAFFNFAIQIPDLKRIGYRYRFVIDLKHPGVKTILGLMVPIIIGLSIGQVNLFVNQNIASHLPAGIIAALHTGQRLMQVPIGIFGIAIAMTIFPTLTEQVAKNEMGQYKKTANLGIRSVIFITMPAAAGLMALSMPIVRMLFEQGAFKHEDTLVTSVALFYYSIGLFSHSAIQVLNRVFYAIQDTVSPVAVGALSIIINIWGSLTLIKYLPYGGGGIALAYSIAGIFNLALLLYWLRRKVGPYGGKKLLISVGKSFFASLFMGLLVYYISGGVESVLDMTLKVNQAIQVAVGIASGAAIYAGVASLLKMDESEMVMSIIRRRFGRSKKLV